MTLNDLSWPFQASSSCCLSQIISLEIFLIFLITSSKILVGLGTAGSDYWNCRTPVLDYFNNVNAFCRFAILFDFWGNFWGI